MCLKTDGEEGLLSPIPSVGSTLDAPAEATYDRN